METKVIEPWSEKYEMLFWTNSSDAYHLKNLESKWNHFSMQKWLTSEMTKFADIGGGLYGGALRYVSEGKMKVLLDPLAYEFSMLGKLPDDVISITAKCGSLAFFPSCSFHVIFCWELFDHLLDVTDLEVSVVNIYNMLKQNGLLFVHHLIRKESQEGHSFPVSSTLLKKLLTGYKIEWESDERFALWLICRKV